MTSTVVTAVLVFWLTVATDALVVLYTRRVAQGRALSAALFSVATVGIDACIFVAYMTDIRYVGAVAVGTFVGTWFAIRTDAPKEKP